MSNAPPTFQIANPAVTNVTNRLPLSWPKSHDPSAGAWQAVQRALDKAQPEPFQLIKLDIQSGTHIESEIGQHFGEVMLSAARLATSSACTGTVVLWPHAEQAASRCLVYFRAFAQAAVLDDAPSRLVVVLPQSILLPRDADSIEAAEIAFDPALHPEEMEAYVAMRMIDRPGPGSSKLLAALVTEYAGFDAVLAERVIAMDEAKLLNLPHSLAPLMLEDPARWRHAQWAMGSCTVVGGKQIHHSLHEWYLASHPGAQQQTALKASQKRYRRACLHTLIPWMEERRPQVLTLLRKPIEHHLATTGGKLLRTLPNGNRIELDIDAMEMEFNTVTGLAHQGLIRVPGDARSQKALAVCKLAKKVRDDVSHLRAPASRTVVDLVTAMDQLL